MSTKYLNIDNISCIQYYSKFIEDIDTNMCEIIKNEVTFLSDEKSAIFIMGKKVNIPRKQCAYGDAGTNYTFSGISVKGNTWEDAPNLKKIKDIIHKKLNIPVNYVLVNLYEDGNEYIGWHSDDEKDIDQNHPIVSLSFGSERSFLLRDKRTKDTYEKVLENNSCILMKPPCQKLYKHSLPKRKKVKLPRINLTFRVIKT